MSALRTTASTFVPGALSHVLAEKTVQVEKTDAKSSITSADDLFKLIPEHAAEWVTQQAAMRLSHEQRHKMSSWLLRESYTRRMMWAPYQKELFFAMHKLGHVSQRDRHHTAVQKYQTDVLYVNWPSYAESWATDALKEFKGEFVVFIGEGAGGCTADDEFFQILSAWKEIDVGTADTYQKNWYGIHCFPRIYRRA
jgi:hypothetical protein